jgi:hypothetical protein
MPARTPHHIEAQVIALYRAGLYLHEIAAQLQRDRKTVWAILVRNDVPRDRLIRDAESRWTASFERGGPDACWPWRARLDGDGYGVFSVDGESQRAHRLMYEREVGPIPAGMVVRHRCDNRPCVNPSHLLVGTPQDNNRDAVERERQARGERIASATLTEDQVREILTSSEPNRVLADRYGVTLQGVWLIRKRINWKHVEI